MQEQVLAYTKEEVESYKSTIRELEKRNAYLEQELAQLKRMIFGQKRERFLPQDDGQLALFQELAQQQASKEIEDISYQRKKPEREKDKAKRLLLPAHLPREEETIEPEGDTTDTKKIGEEVTEILEYNPGKLFVRRIIRPKYVKQSEDQTQTVVFIGELPTLTIPKGNAGPGLLAHLLISKFVDHLPFYRQVQQFKREGVEIAESTIGGWFTASCSLLKPLYDTLVKELKQAAYLMADETPIPVLTKDKPGSTHKGYHWVYYDPLKKLVCFEYREGRGREGPKAFLKDFKGSLQTDGYVVYDDFGNQEGISLLACMAHARRKFEQAIDNDKANATFALSKIQGLYALERKAREDGFTFDQRKELRQQHALPILEDLEKWLKEKINTTLPKSKIGEAMAYTIKLWPRLIRYIEDGRYEIDNNQIENSIRPVALGRKNYLFAGSHQGAMQAAMMYSFVGTCKFHGINPFLWLRKVLAIIPDHHANKLSELLPGNLYFE
jgi:transposase